MTAEARQMLQQAQASGNPDDMLKAGAFALQAGIQAEAVAPVQKTLRSHPEYARLWQLLGLLYRDLEKLAPSVEAFAKAAELAPDDAMIAHGRACVCYEAGLPAAPLFERAMFLDPSDRAMLLRHAAAQIAEGRVEAAIAALEDELSRNPGWREGHAALARVRWNRGERETFCDSYERALLAAPRTVALWGGYVETLLHDQLYARALAVIDRARSVAGPHPSFDAAEAVARSELGEKEAAGAYFDRLAHVGDVTIVVPYLRFLLRAGRVQEAADVAGRKAPNDPNNRIWPYLSIAWRLLGDPRWEWLEGDPRFIGVYDIAESMPPLDALAERLRALHNTVHQPLDQSLRGGTQTVGHLFHRIEPEIAMLRQAVVAAVERHVAQLPAPQPNHPLLVQRRAPIGFSGSWSVRLAGGGRHVDHVHPAGWLSSALYIVLPGEAERGPADNGWLSLGQAGELGIDLPPIRLIEPKPGRLVLFPSTMWHGTRPFDAGERLSVAFDVKRPG
jgi:cytochrome c-type biogenesis protein CcmH/NrfG